MDFSDGTILIDRQLQSLRSGVRGDKEKYALVPTKNSKERAITAVPYVMDLLWQAKKEQDLNRKHNSDLFQDNGLVFTDEFGTRITPQALYRAFKLADKGKQKIVFEIRNITDFKSGKWQKETPEFRRILGESNGVFEPNVYS